MSTKRKAQVRTQKFEVNMASRNGKVGANVPKYVAQQEFKTPQETAAALDVDAVARQLDLGMVPYDICQVDPALIKVDTYQRDIKWAAIKRWARESHNAWLEPLAGTLILNMRESDGEVYVIDGLQRSQLALMLRVEAVLAKVFFGLTKAQESDLFHALQKNRVGLKAGEKFRALLDGSGAESEAAREARDIMRRYGIELDLDCKRGGSTSHFVAFYSLQQVLKEGGPELVERVMALIDTCWKRPRDRHEALAGDPFLAFGLVLARHPLLELPRLIKILQSKVVSDIAQEGARVKADNPGLTIAGSGLMYHGLLSLYNYRITAARKEIPVRKQGVPIWDTRAAHPSTKYSDAFIQQIAAEYAVLPKNRASLESLGERHELTANQVDYIIRQSKKMGDAE